MRSNIKVATTVGHINDTNAIQATVRVMIRDAPDIREISGN